MDKGRSSNNLSVRWKECIGIKIEEDCFPQWFLNELLNAADSISVSHEALFHHIVSSVNYTMLHSEVSIENKEWIEPVILWNLVIAMSGSRKTVIYKICSNMLKEAVEMLERNDGLVVKQFHFNDGSVEKIGLIMKDNTGKLSILQDEAARHIMSSSACMGKKMSESSFEMLLLEAYNGGELLHQTVGSTNYKIERAGLIAGGFTQPELGMGFIKDSNRSATGYPQRFNFHFVQTKHLELRQLCSMSEVFKSGLVRDVMYPLLKDSNLRGHKVKQYILANNSEAFCMFDDYFNEMRRVKNRLSAIFLPGYDTVCSYIGKMDGKILRESAILTELLPRLHASLNKLPFVHSTHTFDKESHSSPSQDKDLDETMSLHSDENENVDDIDSALMMVRKYFIIKYLNTILLI